MSRRLRRSGTKPGIVYTFYSYKGGVGRTMALVNVGVLLALTDAGEKVRPRVLLVDWDLEAPGLDTYFELIDASKRSSNRGARPGVVDLLEAQSKDESLSWRDCLSTVSFTGGDLDFISAGKREGSQEPVTDYTTRVQRLNWAELFDAHSIGNYWNQVRREWIEEYDYVLIDSRTGYTDIGDICTVLLADILVLCFVTNYQNIHGINQALKRARQARDALPVDRSRLIAIPVGMRDEIYNERAKALEMARYLFERTWVSL
jgi:cellulose biosynthesis protein BcsQ